MITFSNILAPLNPKLGKPTYTYDAGECADKKMLGITMKTATRTALYRMVILVRSIFIRLSKRFSYSRKNNLNKDFSPDSIGLNVT